MKACYLVIMVYLLIFNFSSGQSELDSKPYYEFYDASLNYFNSGVFNGFEYVDEFRSLKTDNHKFYGSFDFSLGYVFYGGQPYYNLKMKYDLMRDVVVVEFVNEKVNNLFLNSILLSEFKLNNDKFVRLSDNENLRSFYGNGFFKEAYRGNDYAFYIKYIKKEIEKTYDKKVFYVFKERVIFVVEHNQVFFKIDKLKDLTDALPAKASQIKAFYKNSKRLFKANRDQFFISLLKSLED